MSQLSLNMNFENNLTLENFFLEGNEKIISKIFEIIESQLKKSLFISGGENFGKTHLLQSACLKAQEFYLSSIFIPLSNYEKISENILDGLENINLICIDDISNIIGNFEFENIFLKFLQRTKKNRSKLIVSSNLAIDKINFSNKDLKKFFLSFFEGITLKSLTDEQKIKAFIFRAKLIGLDVDDKVAKFLLKKSLNNLSKIFDFLYKLDKASLNEKRKLTIPFVKKILDL